MTESDRRTLWPGALAGVGLPVVWVVSAKSVAGLAGQAGRLAAHLAADAGVGVVDVAWSLAATRSVFEYRGVVVGADREGLLGGLVGLGRGERVAGVVTGVVGGGKVAWVFPGQGSQRVGMGRELYERFPVFREVFDRACVVMEQRLGCSVRDVVLGEVDGDGDGLVGQTLYAQTGLFALGVGLAALLGSWGMRPDVVAGHSVGEITAAYVAGVLSLEDAAGLVAVRARLMQDLPAGGAMSAIAAGEVEVRRSLVELSGVAGRVDVAAVNGPEAVVVSGDAEAVAVVGGWWEGQGRRVRSLRVSHAFHSYRMDPVLGVLGEVAAGLTHGTARIAMVLGLTGRLAQPGELSADYWVRQARQPVRYADTVQALRQWGVETFLEPGPDGALCVLGQACLATPDDQSEGAGSGWRGSGWRGSGWCGVCAGVAGRVV